MKNLPEIQPIPKPPRKGSPLCVRLFPAQEKKVRLLMRRHKKNRGALFEWMVDEVFAAYEATKRKRS